jgi:hypothetical protein
MTPPHIASWLIILFMPQDEAQEIQGDLLEEFLELASHSGVRAARSWYWRQTIKTVAAMFFDGFRAAQWMIAVIAAWFLSGYAHRGYQRMVVAFLSHVDVYRYVSPYGFWFFYEIVIGCLIIPMLLGSLLALATPKREMVAAVTFGLWNGIWFGIHGAAFPGVKWISGWGVLTHLYIWSDYRFPRPVASVILASTFLSPFMIAIGARITSRFVTHISVRRTVKPS